MLHIAHDESNLHNNMTTSQYAYHREKLSSIVFDSCLEKLAG